jgi:para-aminobenzoate synthetase component 1
VVGGRLCTDLLDLTSDLSVLDSSGFWAVVLPFDGDPVCARFANVRAARPWPGRPWVGPDPASWRSSLDHDAFVAGVQTIRSEITAGDVFFGEH